jgi:hypothetical protein
MAVVKGNYTKSKAKIKATLHYITHRPTLTGKRTTRALFGLDGVIDKQQAYQMIDEAQRGTAFFRLSISPDPKREDKRRDLDLKTVTRKTILTLEKRLQRKVKFIAVEHNDHSGIRHIHAIVMVKLSRGERLGADDFRLLRQAATDSALQQRLALDLGVKRQRDRGYTRSLIGMTGGRAVQGRGGGRVKLPRLTCPECGFRQPMYTLKSGIHWCPTCHLKLNQDREKIRHLQLGL